MKSIFYIKSSFLLTVVLIFNTTLLFAGGNPPQGPTTPPDYMEVDLKAFSSNGPEVVDAILAIYHADFLAAVDQLDAAKMYNTGESIAFLREDIALCIERRPAVADRDTQFINLVHMVAGKDYQFEFLPNFASTGVTAYLQDSYLGIDILVSTDTATNYGFSINSDPASSSATRFRLVFFNSLNSRLAINFTGFKAYQENNDIKLDWKVDNETDVKQYEIERSADGTNFTKVHTSNALNRTTGVYGWVDMNPLAGNNFYRIRSVQITGEKKYSTILKVAMANAGAGITVYPTAVTGTTINIRFDDMDKGNYAIRLINTMGHVVSASTILHPGGRLTSSIQTGNLERGQYYLEVIHPDNGKTVKALMLLK